MDSPLIINEPPLMVLPSLAVALGLNEAIILQQIHYWCNDKRSKTVHDGYVWTYNTAVEWKEQFPFLGVDTIRRALKSLRDKGIVVTAKLANNKYDHTLYYRIDYCKIPTTIYAKCLNQEVCKMHKSLSETSTEITSKESVQGEDVVPSGTTVEPLPVAKKVSLGRDTQQRDRCIEELYRAFREVYDSIPAEVEIHYPAYEKVKAFLTPLHTDCKATPDQVRKAMRKLLSAKDKKYVSAKTLLEEWQSLTHVPPAKTLSPRSARPPFPAPVPVEVDTTPYTEEERLARRKELWEMMWAERKHEAHFGNFPTAAERVAYNALTDAQKAQSRAQGYVEGFCPVFEEYMV